LVWRIVEQTGRSAGDIVLRDGDYDQIHAADGFGNRDGGRACFGDQIRERLGSARELATKTS
jgi:hypothetical protein